MSATTPPDEGDPFPGEGGSPIDWPLPVLGRPGLTRGSRQRWRSIIDAAAVIFCDRGYEQTTVAEIAEAVGLLKGSVYHYIRSKDDLLYAVMADHHESVRWVRDAVGAKGGSAVERLGYLIEAHVRADLADPHRSAVFYRDFRFVTGERRATVVAQRDDYERFVRALITEAQRAGAIRTGMDAKQTTRLILGALNSGHQWYRAEGPASPPVIARAMRTMLLEGITTPAAAGPPTEGQDPCT